MFGLMCVGFYFCVFSSVSFMDLVESQKIVTMKTKLGQINGVGVDVNGKMVYQFRKIPYAKPPIGQLRFAKPQPFGSWNGTLNATEFGPSCMQEMQPAENLPNSEISEDCLYLNIYVPYSWFEMNVMVYIHGGGFKQGQGMKFNASALAQKGHAIVVTLNYRLNIFGFLATGDSTAPGNFGLWDQQMAIEWVKSNIYDYDGDPNSITIFGESAGGISVGFQSLYPGNKGLFNRAIMESGVGNSLFATNTRELAAYQTFGLILNCPVNDSSAFVKCLQKINASSLSNEWLKFKNETMATGLPHFGGIDSPIVDGSFILGDPASLLKNTSSPSYTFLRSLDIMAGTTNGEGSLIIQRLKPFEHKYSFNLSYGIPTEVFCDYIAASIAVDYFDKHIAISAAICKKYKVTPPGNIGEQGRQVANMFGDAFLVSPTVQLLDAHSRNNNKTKSYQYLFSRALPSRAPPTKWFTGASHSWELPYLFGFDSFFGPNKTIPVADFELSENMIGYWTSFAYSGNPNGQSSPNWPEYADQSAYENLDINITSGQHVYEDRVKFWLYDLPKIFKEN